VSTQLKSYFTGLRTQRRKPPLNIHATGVSPERGNRYSYHLEDGCSSFEDRTVTPAAPHPNDTCVGADKYRHEDFPPTFTPVAPDSASWDPQATAAGMAGASGLYGGADAWDFLVYAAGDVDGRLADAPDTWLISSSDGEVAAACPDTGGVADVLSAGEPYIVSNDAYCD
jgi:type IV pilus assembly protein PilA